MRVATVVQCTSSKRQANGPPPGLGDVVPSPVDERIAAWLQHRDLEDPVPARDLYKGVGWSASLDLIEAIEAAGMEAAARVVSAGHGLVALNAGIAPYEATFAVGHPHGVEPESEHDHDARAWWVALHPNASGRPITALARKVDAVLVAMSRLYVNAVADDLAEAMRHVPAIVFSAGGPHDNRLAAVSPVFDRRLREGADPFVPGSDQNLNQRVARRAVELLGKDVFDPDSVHELINTEMARRPAPERYDRRVSTDDAVTAFVTRSLQRDPTLTKTALLRQWRDIGRACEQRRFGELFANVKSAMEREGDQLVLGD